MASPYFGPELFDFLRELRANNERAWFQANRDRYERVARGPALRFIEDVAPRLRAVSRHLVADARPAGGSLFRINRDIRFSADKSPYKTAVAMSFGHDQGGGRHAPSPGLYLHLEPGESFAGGGVHFAGAETLRLIRDAIVADPRGWGRIVANPEIAPLVTPYGDGYKRVPAGYDPAHRWAEDLKRRSFSWHASFTEAEVCGVDFMDRYLGVCATANPFVRFLARATGTPW